MGGWAGHQGEENTPDTGGPTWIKALRTPERQEGRPQGHRVSGAHAPWAGPGAAGGRKAASARPKQPGSPRNHPGGRKDGDATAPVLPACLCQARPQLSARADLHTRQEPAPQLFPANTSHTQVCCRGGTSLPGGQDGRSWVRGGSDTGKAPRPRASSGGTICPARGLHPDAWMLPRCGEAVGLPQ